MRCFKISFDFILLNTFVVNDAVDDDDGVGDVVEIVVGIVEFVLKLDVIQLDVDVVFIISFDC